VFRLLISIISLGILITACGVASESGGASEPVVSAANPTSEAGAIAASSDVINPETCEGVLGEPPVQYRLDTNPLTDVATQSEQQIESMCSALFDSGAPGGTFLAVTLFQFSSDGPAVDQYELIKSGFVEGGVPFSELNNADEGLTDRVSALIDSGGMGRITAMRQNHWVVTVSFGPSTEFAPWLVGDLEMIGLGVLERVR